ncbi:MAG: hypothetical protein Q7O66_03995 [Dehalococcoidia bacterium]|nr:hypothetical protein [Dehalococcoidia bacterium]
MGWQTKASGDAKTIPNVALEKGDHRIVITVPSLVAGMAAAVASAVGGLVGATKVETSGNSIFVYFTVG